MNHFIYSFDIFDTCFTRTYAYPIDLFYDLAKLMFSSRNKNSSNNEIGQLAKYRILAEKRARKIYREYREDISVDKIYENFCELKKWSINPQHMMSTEIELEEKSIYPVPEIKLRIEKLRKQGNEIIFISDMYLPTSFIKNCLLKHGLAHEKDSVYVSGEIGLTKHSGNLFKYVLKQKNCKPEDLFHLGDNSNTDYNVPRQLGISAELFENAKLTRYEKVIAKTNIISCEIASRSSAISRIIRLNAIADGNDKFLAQLASNVIAPLLTVFVFWILEDAQRNNYEKLYFVSRDGQILYKIAKKIVESQSIPIECRYLYGSRQAWLLPSVENCTREELDWLVPNGTSTTPREILNRLYIDPCEVREILDQHHLTERLDEFLNSSGLENFWYLIENQLCNIIKTKSQINRELAFNYFTQEGLNSSKKWALVDIGWTASCLRSVQKIINNYGYSLYVYGYYFGIKKSDISKKMLGHYSAFIDQNNVEMDNKFSWLFKTHAILILEHIFTISDHPSVIKYQTIGEKILPVFAENFNKEQHKLAQNIHKIVINYTDHLIELGLLKKYTDYSFKQISIEILKLFLTKPRKEEVQTIANQSVCTEQTHNLSLHHKIVRPLSFNDAFLIILKKLANQTPSTILWLQGCAQLSSPLVKFTITSLLKIQDMVVNLKRKVR